ncbi:amidohydrolase [Herbiconiux sp. KACC 21604]|uniref:amidohydrolase n=1 Tax=unclassified Herbiconiux TaxID=2618217 RepID=UPI0014927EBC|nr:amidohydrolase [Herbiconiux sp. SALV-R1]QJU55022.1 amidohydrolase [Herbiconiux sp. SALV-R1]WPO86159.1 amidohydrolase [Herbiconiux sp. KACC 21604]
MKLDLVVENATIHTFDGDTPRASSIGILNGRIVGLDDDLRGVTSREVIDAGGRAVFPGFIDAHCHTSWFGLSILEPSVDRCRSLDELYAALGAAIVERGGSVDDWLVVNGFDHNIVGGYPELSAVDLATGETPVFLRHNSGHLAFVNSAALRRVGAVDPRHPNPAGGEISRDGYGAPTGRVEETAQEIFQAHFRPRPLELLQRAVEVATRRYAAQGITSFTDAGIGAGWIGQSPVELAAYQRAVAAGSLAARAQVMPVLDALHGLDAHPDDGDGLGLDLGLHSGFGSDLLSLGPAKVFLDGSLLGQTAAISEPYCSHPGSGYFQDDPKELRHAMERAYAAGWSLAVHAIGDRAIDLALDCLEDLQQRGRPRTMPNRIEHASIVRPDQLSRIARAGIAVTPQASFFEHGGDAMTRSLGPRRAGWAYRVKSFLERGVVVGGSSDRPVADGDPLRGMTAYIGRLTASGQVFGDPAERVSPREALALYTTGSAAACGISASRGSLSPGKLADLVILEEDPLTTGSFDTSVTATITGGVLTHQA